MRWDPFGEFDRLTQGFWPGDRRPVVPMDAYRRGDRFVVHLDLPGVDPESIDMTVERNVLTIRAERDTLPGEDDQPIVTERPRGTFTRQLFLGETLDVERLEARYENGVLTVTIPVAEEARPRKIEVATGNGAAEIPAGQTTS